MKQRLRLSSLRSRLVATVLALAAAALAALAAITYAEQRSFLRDQITRELRDSGSAVAQALSAPAGLAGRTLFGPGASGPETERENAGKAGGGSGAVATSTGGTTSGGSNGAGAGVAGRSRPPASSPGPPGAGTPNLPPGTFGQLRGADGSVIRNVTFNYGVETRAVPSLPARMMPGRVIEVGSRQGAGRYLALARTEPPSEGLVIVALPLAESEAVLRQLLIVEALVAIAVLALLAISASLLVRLGLRPLQRMAGSAERIAGGELSRRIAGGGGGSEVTRLGAALNRMLDRLEQAFSQRTASEERLRLFLADASHELRTPLASIRGYAELYRMGAAGRPEVLDRAMQRIEQESERMGGLVESLLALAHAEESSPAPPEPLDLAELAGDALQDARAAAPDRQIDLHGAASATVCGDRDQLRSVLANLLRNATLHTPAGTAIEISLSTGGGTATLCVRDHGAGLPPGPPEQIFERFWRADRHASHGRDGSGLGLAIVSSVVKAHGGSVLARNAPGGGAEFLVRLPLAGSDSNAATG